MNAHLLTNVATGGYQCGSPLVGDVSTSVGFYNGFVQSMLQEFQGSFCAAHVLFLQSRQRHGEESVLVHLNVGAWNTLANAVSRMIREAIVALASKHMQHPSSSAQNS